MHSCLQRECYLLCVYSSFTEKVQLRGNNEVLMQEIDNSNAPVIFTLLAGNILAVINTFASFPIHCVKTLKQGTQLICSD